MPTQLFWSAVDQIVEAGAKRMAPFINGDPFADTRMAAFVTGMASKYPDLSVTIYTNGMLATADVVEPILSAGNVNELIFSVQGGTPSSFRQNTGLDWNTVWSHIETALKIKHSLSSPTIIFVTMCQFSKTMSEVAMLQEECARRGVECRLGCFSNFGGMVRDTVGEAVTAHMPRQVCDRAMSHAYIYNNGDVGQCCFDLVGDTIYGNVKASRLVDVLNSAQFIRMREAHARLDIEAMPRVCRECNAPRFHG